MITQKGREAKPTILTSVVNALLSVAKAKRALSQIFKLQHCMTVSAQPLDCWQQSLQAVQMTPWIRTACLVVTEQELC